MNITQFKTAAATMVLTASMSATAAFAILKDINLAIGSPETWGVILGAPLVLGGFAMIYIWRKMATLHADFFLLAKSIEDLRNVVPGDYHFEETRSLALLSENIIEEGRNVEEHKKEKELVISTKDIDKLTGLPNKNAADEQVKHALNRVRLFDQDVTILIMDLDHFKMVNDTYGHGVGDMVLKKLAETIRVTLRHTDKVYRWGGEEFVAMVPTGLEGGLMTAEKVRQAVEKIQFDQVGRKTVSIGVAQFNKEERYDELFERADKALYEAKHSGRNRVCSAG